MSKLEVTKFNDGSLIRVKEGSDWGTIMVTKETTTMSNGFLNTSKRVGFIRDKVENLEALGLQEGDDFNAKLNSLGAAEADIFVVESLQGDEGQSPKQYPEGHDRAGDVIKDAEGNPIYYKTVVATKGSMEDQRIPSGNAVEQPQESGEIA